MNYKKLIIAAFNWYEEECKHTTEVNNEIATELFLDTEQFKEMVNEQEANFTTEYLE